MKSEFVLAFNEICETRGLPKEDVFEALKTAIVSAYRRDMNVSNTQKVRVEIDPRTGDPTVYAEKEVVDQIIDNRTEVLIDHAQRSGYPEAELGDLVMIDSTTPQFGRIAAQTAKQVLLQRVREAEREHLYEDFSGREGELVNGTVQSVSGQHITIGLGRTEATLPKSQQVHGERYRAHDKIRVYVLEVRRTSRGPQIIVSRNHRNLLRRLLELEVPEIYNGQVEIKSIAREAGQRSKVAVQALQPGVDPVGACVGMRGVRIQSIVRELNDEKIDVIEWDSDQKVFIAKALSPARVSHVFLEDHPDEGKTAVVIVPDDQLSLAIGREGQNARLAAKLTSWRIDIKSLTEAAAESLAKLDHPDVDHHVQRNKDLIQMVQQVLAKKEAGRPITSEDYLALDRLVSGVLGKIIIARANSYDETRKQRALARKKVPADAWKLPLDVLDLPGRIHNLLLDNHVETVGDVLMNLEIGNEVFLNFRGFGDKALEVVQEAVSRYQAIVAGGETVSVEVVTPKTDVETAVSEPTITLPLPVAETPISVALPVDEPEEELETAASVEEEMKPEIPPIEDLSQPLVPITPPTPVVAPVIKKPAKPVVIMARPVPDEKEDDSRKPKVKSKGKQLVFDEKRGEVTAKRKHKDSRRRPDEWDEDLEY